MLPFRKRPALTFPIGLTPAEQRKVRRYAKLAATFRLEYQRALPNVQTRDLPGMVTAHYIGGFVAQEGRLGPPKVLVRTIGPEVPRRDAIPEGEDDMLAISLTTGMKRGVSYAGVPAADEDGNAVQIVGVSAAPDNPDMITIEAGSDPLSYVVKDNPTTGTGDTPITETFTDANGNTFSQRGIVSVLAGAAVSVGDATVGEETDRDEAPPEETPAPE